MTLTLLIGQWLGAVLRNTEPLFDYVSQMAEGQASLLKGEGFQGLLQKAHALGLVACMQMEEALVGVQTGAIKTLQLTHAQDKLKFDDHSYILVSAHWMQSMSAKCSHV